MLFLFFCSVSSGGETMLEWRKDHFVVNDDVDVTDREALLLHREKIKWQLCIVFQGKVFCNLKIHCFFLSFMSVNEESLSLVLLAG